MPDAPLRYCLEPGCTAKARRKPRCPKHERRVGTTAQRGYGAAWQRLSRAYLHAHPMCECGCGRRSEHTDHMVSKARGGTDDWSNLQALSCPCHSRKTVMEDGGFGR